MESRISKQDSRSQIHLFYKSMRFFFSLFEPNAALLACKKSLQLASPSSLRVSKFFRDVTWIWFSFGVVWQDETSASEDVVPFSARSTPSTSRT